MALAKATKVYGAEGDLLMVHPDDQAVIEAAIDESDAQPHDEDVPFDAAVARLKSILFG
jgi:hypothetical protein